MSTTLFDPHRDALGRDWQGLHLEGGHHQGLVAQGHIEGLSHRLAGDGGHAQGAMCGQWKVPQHLQRGRLAWQAVQGTDFEAFHQLMAVDHGGRLCAVQRRQATPLAHLGHPPAPGPHQRFGDLDVLNGEVNLGQHTVIHGRK